MGKSITLDAGALIAGDKGGREFWRLWKDLDEDDDTVTVPALVVAQAWRGGASSARLSIILKGCTVDEGFTEEFAKSVGRLLGVSKTKDIVDAAVVLGAISRGDTVFTSAPTDIEHLAAHAGAGVEIVKL